MTLQRIGSRSPQGRREIRGSTSDSMGPRQTASFAFGAVQLATRGSLVKRSVGGRTRRGRTTGSRLRSWPEKQRTEVVFDAAKTLT